MMGEAALKQWAEACEQAKKPAFLLQGTIAKKLSKKPTSWAGSVIRVLDWIAALVLLIGLSPVMLALMALMYAYSPKSIFAFSWRIGLRGKLFKALKFHTNLNNPNSLPTPIERWMRKYRLDEIPKLLNVLRGEMSLLGVRPLTLSQVVQPDPKDQQQMNVLRWGRGSSEFVAEA
jgi:lipopolysaccharide/colanic/teichoic acid biosynthesis glycosyltransferase